MYDSFNRKINYLRISVTDRCNFRCTYCMPEEGVPLMSHHDILSFDEIVELTRLAVSKGIDKVRITGGEPLVRKGIVSLVKMLADIDGIKDLSMTTNGALLPKFAYDLKNAGLNRVNISLDAMDSQRFSEITRSGNLDEVLKGIDSADEAGLLPIKLNCVIKENSLEKDALAVKAFAEKRGFQVRFIHEMSLADGSFSVVEGGEGGHCGICNRLRLSADGQLFPCLFSDIGYSIRELGGEEALNLALKNKPKSGTTSVGHEFYNIGG
ncbi:MAG: radical SAM protein [Marinilabiliales bacterium]|nr:MAG: radical SAM protein [Marinilabiliales bacterium]